MSEEVVLGIDGGRLVLGYCIAGFLAQRRRVISSGSLRDVEPLKLVRWLQALLLEHQPHVVAIEDYCWYGPERSSNSNAFEQSRIVGDVEGAALMWGEIRSPGCVRVARIRKADANRAMGLVGKTAKSRVGTAVRAFFPTASFNNEHERDAAVVCVAGHFRRSA